MNIVLMNSKKSAGDVRFPVIIGIISMWGIALSLSYLLGVHYELVILGIRLTQGTAESMRGCFALKRWLTKPWERFVKTVLNKFLLKYKKTIRSYPLMVLF